MQSLHKSFMIQLLTASKILSAAVVRLCRNPGLNRGPLDLQSNALPTELFRPMEIRPRPVNLVTAHSKDYYFRCFFGLNMNKCNSCEPFGTKGTSQIIRGRTCEDNTSGQKTRYQGASPERRLWDSIPRVRNT